MTRFLRPLCFDFVAAGDGDGEGEALLRSRGNLMFLGSMLCWRAELEHTDGQPEAAHAALSEAEALAARLGVGPSAQLALDLTRARQTLAR